MSAATKLLYIETVGCQMNVLDSELVVASLRNRGYDLTDQPKHADTILFNTCSVRQRAEDKVYSALGRLKRLKQQHPGKIIGVIGCMAQKDSSSIFQRVPYVDLVVGPGQLHQIPDLVEKIELGEGRQMEISLGRTDGSADKIKRSHESFDPLRDPTMRPTPWQAYVRIQIGCDKFCTYCIVPMVRGPEQGRPPCDIVSETETLANQGCREIILLGQTVNSYRHTSAEERTTSFAGLLHRVHEVDGIDRIKFVTNYPLDMTNEVLEAVRDLPKVSSYLHVPAQSGSDRMLQAMKRGYTIAQYRDMMQRIHEIVPNAAVSSDFIVGFCGETEEDFEQTVQLVEECRFKNSFIFKYSERPTTKAAERIPDDIPNEVKKARNNRLLEVQNRISMEDNQRFIGEKVTVLVEGPSKAAEKSESGPLMQMTGRTQCDRIVVFDGNERQAGQMMDVMIYDAHSHTLFGEVETQHVVPEVHQLQL